jgi:single-strand DNA-binding protein
MNNVCLHGRITAEPEVRYTQGSEPIAIARFTLAVDRKFKKGGQPTADFINCKAFGKTAEVVQKYLDKGSEITAVGSIQTGSYEKDGRKIYTTDIVVNEFDFCGKKDGSDKKETKKETSEFVALSDDFDEDSIPF